MDAQQEIQALRDQIEELQWEKELIRQRVTIKVRDLLFENEELKKTVAYLEYRLREEKKSALSAERRNSLPDNQYSISPPNNKLNMSASLDRSTSGTPVGTPVLERKESGEKGKSPLSQSGSSGTPPTDRNATLKSSQSSSWKSKVKASLSRRKTSMFFKGDIPDDEEEEEGEFDESHGTEEETKEPEMDFYDEEDTFDLVYIKQEGTNKMPLVKAGTAMRLIERLVPEKYPDPDYVGHFLLTYRSFTTPENLLESLIRLFTASPPSDATPEQIEEHKLKQTPVRLRITNVIKTWLGRRHAYDLDETMIARIQQFAETIDDAKQATLIKNALEGFQKYSRELHHFVPSTSPPKPMFSRENGAVQSVTLIDVDPLELARQLTLIEFDYFKLICPKECLNQSWIKARKEEFSPNVLRMIHWSNDVSAWVSSEILRRDSPKLRADIIKIFIKIAKHCHTLNNYNAVFEILAGLGSSAVNRLRKSWEKLDKSVVPVLKEIQEVSSREKNFSNLREALKKSLPPCIPYLGMFLTDLTFIDTGNPDKLTGEHNSEELINFNKLRKTAVVIKNMQLFQQTGYSLEVVSEIRDYFMKIKEANLTEDQSYKASLTLEPREQQ